MTEWDVLMQIAKGEIFTIAKPIINRNEKKKRAISKHISRHIYSRAWEEW